LRVLFEEENALDDPNSLRRAARGCARCLVSGNSSSSSSGGGGVGSAEGVVRIGDVAVAVLRRLASVQGVREELGGRLDAVCAYTRNVFSENEPMWLKLAVLGLVEQLSVYSPVVGIVFGRELGALLVDCLSTNELKETALKVMLNLANHCPEGARELVAAGVVPAVMRTLQGALNKRDLVELDHAHFTCVLLCLGLLGNLVEYPEAGASLQLAGSESMLGFLCEVYASSLPIRARQSLESGGGSETIEFDWTAEALVVSAHACLVLGCLIRDSKEASAAVQRLTPGGKQRGFSPLTQVLQGFLSFQAEAGVLNEDMDASIRKVAGYFSDANSRSMLPPSSLLPPPRSSGRTATTSSGSGGSSLMNAGDGASSSSSSSSSGGANKKQRMPS